jgi:3-hydroxyanthranilate 3,4-dioxygenase
MPQNTLTTISTETEPQPFMLFEWLKENKHKLKPPTAGHTIFFERDFMVTVLGQNSRTDYHLNPYEEFFFTLEGEMTLRIQYKGAPHDIRIPAGGLYVLPAGVPHAPMRPAGSIGIILEKIRKTSDPLDQHRWYCEKCNNVLWNKFVYIEVVERDMPPVFDEYYSNPEHQHCKRCGHHNPGRPKAA